MKKLVPFILALQIVAAAQLTRTNRTIDEQKEVNQRIFALLEKSGAAEGEMYAFDQILSSTSEAKIAAVREELRRLGYVADGIGSHVNQGDVTYYVDAYKRMEYHRDALERDSFATLEFAEKHQVFYDGWGAELGTKEEPNQALQPTPMLVTPRADARVAPSTGVADL